jgi:hypothetical protein
MAERKERKKEKKQMRKWKKDKKQFLACEDSSDSRLTEGIENPGRVG